MESFIAVINFRIEISRSRAAVGWLHGVRPAAVSELIGPAKDFFGPAATA
jgi:hypothetical protein